MERWARLIGWIDREWEAVRAMYSLPLLTILGWAILPITNFHPIALVVAIVWTALWFGLFGWRFVVWARKADGQYDRRAKYKLSKEYWSTESASAEAEMRDRQRKGEKGQR
jgi:hypothetical protein